MANYTINNLPNVLESVADSDKLPIWDASASRTAQITRSNLLGISQNKVIAVSGTTVTGDELEPNAILRLYFTAEIAGSDGTTPMAISYNGTSYTVKVAKNGSLTDFVAHEISSGTFKYLQAYTVLELLYNGTQFVIVGNPIVLSSSDYTIYADGSVKTVDIVADGNMNPVTSNAVYDAIAPIGTSITANPYSLPVTLQPNAPTAIGEITLTPGTWIVIVSGWNFVEDPANILYVCLNSNWFMSSKPSNGWEIVGYYETSTNKVVKVNAYNSNSSAINVTSRSWRITAVRLA